jgi:ABC-type dipeptide/oligopeptide/nickel transport system permease component
VRFRAITTARHATIAFATVLAAHAAAYALVRVLPPTAQQVLGLAGWSPELRSGLEGARQTRDYGMILRDLARGDLGVSADGVPVRTELAASARSSIPRMLFALGLGFAAAFLAAWTAPARATVATSGWWFLTFFPPYGYSVLAATLVLLLTRGVPVPGGIPWLLCALSAAASPMALLAGQARTVMSFHLTAPHSTYLRANGVGEDRIRLLCLRNALAEMLPTMEKVIAGTLTGLVLAEFLLGLPGFGLLTFRTVRRSDAEMLGGIVLLFASLISLARFSAAMLAPSDQELR